VEAGSHLERRVERVQFETDRHLIVGSITLPPGGYQSRLSDSLNRPDISFIPIVDAEVSSIEGGESEHHDFIVIGKHQIRIAFPVGEAPPRPSPEGSQTS
jgi:hypothetical protein